VDASGSAAVSRLGEAKGAIELLLAEAYASRDQVALISFRGTEAEVLLPPTRSLVQTKRRLSALPGGGGTPLAAGLQTALLLAIQSRAKGMTPTVILITDGRANIALDGTANRVQAAADATLMAGAVRAAGIAGLVIDMSNRPQPALAALGQTLCAPYIALPRADAHRLTGAVNAALDG
jgi:magnesium chelatase subunit D